MQELKTNEIRIRAADQDGRYGYDFFLPAEKWHRHAAIFPRLKMTQIRTEGDDFYTLADEVNRTAQRRESNGAEVLPEDDLGGLMTALRKVKSTLQRIS
ncbi:MAG: hypothetical protein ACRDMH_01430 [Solirubrobacterales bacterium]